LPVRILHIVGQLGIGGCERQLTELCRRLPPSRFQTSIAYFYRTAEFRAEDFEVPGTDLVFIDKSRMTLPGFFSALRRTLKDYRPDIIHTWQYSPNWWGRVAGMTCGFRRFVACERTARHLYGRLPRLAERWLGPHTVWVANSRAVARGLASSLPLRIEDIRVIYNAVADPTEDRAACRAAIRAEFGFAPDQPVVLSVGRLADTKNYPMLYRTARSVLSQRPDVRFLVAGHGPLQENLERLGRELDLGDRLRLLGLRYDVPRLMAAADVFCLCSRWEGFPNVLAEAMAAGLPAVTARFPGVEEVAEDGRTALVVDLDDAEMMAARVQELLADPARRQTLADAAHDHVRREFSWPALVGRMESLYEAVAGSPINLKKHLSGEGHATGN
jgi:glycosyltransferase involved in cell wall biosynthesis